MLASIKAPCPNCSKCPSPSTPAHQVFQDVLGIENFTKSEEAFAADALFLAYQSGDAASIQKTVQVGGLLLSGSFSMDAVDALHHASQSFPGL